MRTSYIFVSRDVLSHSNKRILTYKRVDVPGRIAEVFGKRVKSKLVRFVGHDWNWVTYPDGKECPKGVAEMLFIEDGRQSAKHGDLDIRVF